MSFTDELKAFMRDEGIVPPEHIEWDDKIHRYPTNGRANDDAGFYCVTIIPGDPEVAIGWLGDYRVTGPDAISWRSGQGASRDITRELSVMKGKASKEKQVVMEAKAIKCQERWAKLGPADGHPYMVRKGIELSDLVAKRGIDRIPDDIDESGTVLSWKEVDALFIAARNTKGAIRTLQRIYEDGTKKFVAGTGTKDIYCTHGGRPHNGSRLWIAEGVATAQTIKLLTGETCICAFSCHNLLSIAKIFHRKFPDNQICIAGDPGVPGEDLAHGAAMKVRGLVAIPPAEVFQGGDWNDVYLELGQDDARRLLNKCAVEPLPGKPIAVAEEIEPATAEKPLEEVDPLYPTPVCEVPALRTVKTWHSELRMVPETRSKPEHPAANEFNCALYVRNHEDFAGYLGFNTFAQELTLLEYPPWFDSEMISAPAPRQLSDGDMMWFTTQLQRIGLEVGPRVAIPQIENVARMNPFNPLVDLLRSPVWDGELRIDTWISDLLGAEDNKYIRAVGRRFLIGAVARALAPGCKVDTALIIEGKQGLKKSQFIEMLAFGADAAYFSDSPIDFKSKEGSLAIMGRWFCELAELTSFKRADVESAKSFISRREDKFRPPYGRSTIVVPRGCVFVGTTNSEDYLADSTGNRRFWPVKAEKIDLEGLAQVRDQLWAESVVAYDAGERWWLNEDEEPLAEAEQTERVEVDAWRPLVEAYVAKAGYQVVCVGELVLECIHQDTPIAQIKQYDTNRIAAILRNMGWQTDRNVRLNFAPPKYGNRPRAFWHPDLGDISPNDLRRLRMNPTYGVSPPILTGVL